MKAKFVLISALLTNLAFCEESKLSSEINSNLAFDKFDIQVFDINQNSTITNTNIRVLNDKEMQETKGAIWPAWVIGITAGAGIGAWEFYGVQW